MSNNVEKYRSYHEAWSRINDAVDQGFHFEAVTICESIIADRLLSYIVGVEPGCGMGTGTSFAQLIRKWRALAESLPPYGQSGDVGAAVDAWRVERNSVVHGLGKSMPGTATPSVKEFVSRSERAAREGKELARKVSDWHKDQLRHANE